MKLSHHAKTDSLNIELWPGQGAQTREVADGLNVDLDEADAVIGFDIDHASSRLDLLLLETVALPFHDAKIA